MSIITAPRTRTTRNTARACGTSQRPYSRLGEYTDRETGTEREIIGCGLSDGGVLVIDRFTITHTDSRLLARLQPDEAPENAQIVCDLYLEDKTRGRCRRVTTEDYTPDHHPMNGSDGACGMAWRKPQKARDGSSYRIREIPKEDGLAPELRWTRSPQNSPQGSFESVRLREVIAHFQAYEPSRTITLRALAAFGEHDRVSTHRLRRELKLLTSSCVVLNRGLREAVQRKIAQGELSMSEIAVRCGRTRNDRNGNSAGEASWVARRIGQVPETGKDQPTPWIHSDVLALIARDGLGGIPREVELG